MRENLDIKRRKKNKNEPMRKVLTVAGAALVVVKSLGEV